MTDTIELDFGDVKDLGPRSPRVPEGDYLLRVKKVEKETSKADNPMFVVHSEYVDGQYAGQPGPREYLALTEKALFKVFSWIQAITGKNIPKAKIKLPNTTPELTKKFGGKVYGAHIADGDPRTNDKGEEVIYSEVKWHLFAKDVTTGPNKAAKAAEVTASTPAPEQDAAPSEGGPPIGEGDSDPQETTEAAPAADVADQLASFDLDDL